MNYSLFNRGGKLSTLKNRIHERKILQDVLVGQKTQKPEATVIDQWLVIALNFLLGEEREKRKAGAHTCQ